MNLLIISFPPSPGAAIIMTYPYFTLFCENVSVLADIICLITFIFNIYYLSQLKKNEKIAIRIKEIIIKIIIEIIVFIVSFILFFFIWGFGIEFIRKIF